MEWGDHVRAAENILNSSRVPSSLEIISLIKKVNPTRLTLSDTDREHGYDIKTKLQSLLLEHYGETFHLVPHPASHNTVLIKHRTLPSIDACHAPLDSLSRQALLIVETAAPPRLETVELKLVSDKGQRETDMAPSPQDVLKKAQTLLEVYDYVAAEELLGGIRAAGSGDVHLVMRAAEILLHEIGAYQRCIDTILAQSRSILKYRGIRELLAVAYHHNSSLPEARAIFDEINPAQLGGEALFAYADIAFRDGNLSVAFQLAKLAKGKDGFLPGLDDLVNKIEAAMSAQAAPLAQRARAAFESQEFEEARRLACEALEFHPKCRAAREVVSSIESMKEEVQLAELWARLDVTENGERRIALLTTLLGRDRDQSDRIKFLIAEEKTRQRRILFDERLESLRTMVLQERWPECFDSLVTLTSHQDFQERIGEILSLSPFFPALLQNIRLPNTTDRSTKDLWLRLIEVKTALAAGNAGGCFAVMKELKPWFDSCPEFRNDYLMLLQREQKHARKEIDGLLKQSREERDIAEVRRMYRSLRKVMSVLPVEERQELARAMEQRLAQLIPEEDHDEPLEAYREALQIGNSEKAAYLRQEVTDSAAREAIEAEYAEAFHIDLEPLTLMYSDDLPIDLTTRPPLKIDFFTDRHFFLRDGRDTLVVIDLVAKTASRMTSTVFGQATYFDSIKDGVFLFVEERDEEEYGPGVWRVDLSGERAAFTAIFDMREWLEVEDGFSVSALRMSSERDTEYYVMVKHDEGRLPAKIMKKRISPKATIETLQLADRGRTELKLWRWTSCPDRFIVVGEEETRHVNRNLSTKAYLDGTANIYRVRRHGYVYGLEGVRLTKRDFSFNLIECHETAPSLFIYEADRYHGFSAETNTALIVIGDGKQSFYNLSNNKFSNKIRVGRVIPSEEDGRWYCFDYNREERKLMLRDITQEIYTLLQWDDFFCPEEDAENTERLLWFNEDDNFVYKPLEWGTWTPEEIE